MFSYQISFRRTGGGLTPFLLFQTVVSVGMFAILYSQSMLLSYDPKSNDWSPSPLLLLIGVRHSNPHSLRNAALAFLMLAVANIAALLRRTDRSLGVGALILNCLAMAHYAVEVLYFKQINPTLAVVIELLAVASFVGLSLKCERATPASASADATKAE